jgi:hypothetical protein
MPRSTSPTAEVFRRDGMLLAIGPHTSPADGEEPFEPPSATGPWAT